MTSATQARPHDSLVAPSDELGPIATFGAQFFVFGSIIFSFKVTGISLLPALTPVALLVGALGVVLLAPRRVLMRAPVSLVILLMIGWTLASATWSGSDAGTAFALQRDVPILVGFMIVVAMISMDDLVTALLWTIRASVLFTLGIIAVFPETRIHIDPNGVEADLAGWHGYFPHKNIMTPFLVFGLLTVLSFDRTKVIRWVTVALIGVLVVGSDSVTGVSSVVLAVCIWVWLQLFRNLDIRGSSLFLVSSISVGVFGILGIIASLSTVTSASGKDLTFTGRTFIWAASWDALLERPLLGYGLGGILSDVPTSAKTAEVWRAIGFEVPHAHNGVLDVAIQLGFIGLAIFGLLFLTTMVDGIAMVREQPKVGAWVVSTMIVQLYMSLSENVFIGNGWLALLIMFRVLALRTHGMELETGTDLARRLQHPLEARGQLL